MNAHIVIGPEGSGTRLLTKILLSGGCIGDGGHDQRFDDSPPSAGDVDNPIVWRRSVPHFGEEIMPDVDAMVEALDGFDVKILVAVRSPYPLAKSEENFRDLESLDAAYERIQTAYRHIFQEVRSYEFQVIPYEGLARNQAKICDRLGLNEPDVDVYDGNAKYFE